MKKNVCITESLCCTVEINIVNQLYVNKITEIFPKKEKDATRKLL